MKRYVDPTNVTVVNVEVDIGGCCNCPCCKEEYEFSSRPLSFSNTGESGNSNIPIIKPPKRIVQLRRYANTGSQPRYTCEITDVIYDKSLSGWGIARDTSLHWTVCISSSRSFDVLAGEHKAFTFTVDDDMKIRNIKWNDQWENLISQNGKEVINEFKGWEVRFPVEGNLIECPSPHGIHIYNRTSVGYDKKG